MIATDDLPVLATCRSGSLAMLSPMLMVLLLMKALDNDRYGSQRPLTNLTQTFQAHLICALLMWTPSFFLFFFGGGGGGGGGGHPYIRHTTMHHDTVCYDTVGNSHVGNIHPHNYEMKLILQILFFLAIEGHSNTCF